VKFEIESLDNLARWADAFPLNDIRPVDRLAASLFVGCADPRVRLMAMFTAYFDASGNAVNQPYIIVAGYVANYLQWQLFEGSWRQLHAFYGVELPFHMADFVAALENPKYKDQSHARLDYIALAKQPEKADQFLKQLSMLQVGWMHCAISCIVRMEVYNEISSLLDLRDIVPPYALAARMCIQRLRQWEQQFQMDEAGVEYIFEEGDFEQGKFTKLMVDEGEAAPIYKKKKDFAGLQAADQYAWEQYHFLAKHLGKPEVAGRQSFSALLHGIPRLHTHPTRELLIRLCEAKGIDPRTGITK
jgi:hypothetical protein